jgi:hypothetical protein
MTTRERIYAKIKVNEKKIQELLDKNLELERKSYLLSDNKQQYKEQIRTTGRGKNKKTYLEGRIYWIDKFKDEDTGKTIDIERSRAVRIDGEWI